MRTNGQDISGRRFARLLVLRIDPTHIPKRGKPIRWICKCDCGIEKSVAGTILRRSHAKSCGCYSREASSIRNRTHGRTKSAEYRAWQCMRDRCQRPSYRNYHRYGGRGIRVCERWQKFENFFQDIGERPSSNHTLDRKDNNGHYEPKNCRWSTHGEQGSNRSDNHRVLIRGESKTVTEWSRISGVSRTTISDRLKANWEPRRAVFHQRQEAA